ncbi:MAG: thioesterase family protein [Pseudomonadota bacterium]
MSEQIPISTNPDDYAHWTTVTMRYSDQDAMQHINNVAVAAYLEAGRIGFLNDAMAGTSFQHRGMVLGRVTIDFLNEILFEPEIRVGSRLVRVGTRSLNSQYAIFQHGKCCVISESVNVFFDFEKRTSAPPPDDVLAQLKARLKAGG